MKSLRERFSSALNKTVQRESVKDLDAPFKYELSKNPELLGWLLAHFEKVRNNSLVEVSKAVSLGNPTGVQFHSGRLAGAIDSLEFFKTPEEK